MGARLTSRLVGLALVLACSAGGGQVSQRPVAWDCWVMVEDVPHIVCIRDRDGLPLFVEDPEYDPEDLLLEEIHTAIHRGDFMRADRLARINPLAFRHGDIWLIPIYSYPHRQSWAEGRPERLVRAALCRRGEPCKVYLPERR